MNKEELKGLFMSVVNPAPPEEEWQLIEAHYSDGDRRYHTLQHLSEMFGLLKEYYKEELPLTTVLAVFYHDLIYSALRSDNEKQSAQIAKEKLTNWNQAADVINKVEELILLTANHAAVSDEEATVFLDADMAILGSEPDHYEQYRKGVREEFSIYPDFIYNRGRKQFLQKTILQTRIYQSDFFKRRFEAQARINIQNEINRL